MNTNSLKKNVIFIGLLMNLYFGSLLAYIHDYKRVMVNSTNQNNFCIMHIPKNGSSTLREVINVNDLIPYKRVKPKFSKYIKAIVIRDPLYRSISIYNEVMKLRGDGSPYITSQTDFYQNKDDIKLSFKLFLDFIENNFYDPHITHQYKALSKKNLSFEEMDFIFLFEDLENDMKQFCTQNNIQFKPLKENRTPDVKKKCLVDYINSDSSIREKIYKIWQEDFIFYKNGKDARHFINS